jgi:hypothetical protein
MIANMSCSTAFVYLPRFLYVSFLCVFMNAVYLGTAVLVLRSWVTCEPERKWLDKLPNCVS